MKRVQKRLRSPLTIAGCMILAGILAGPAYAQNRDAENRWQAQLDDADRAPLQRLIGHGPAEFNDDLQWHNVKPAPSWQELRDKVVVIQSWTSANEKGRDALGRVRDVVGEFSDIDVQLIALHTPEGADKAADYLEESGLGTVVAVDPVGAFCDALGVYREPVNLVIDRHGAVRHAGLTAEGIRHAVNLLIDEIYDPARCPSQRSATDAASKDFPTFSGSVGRARDMRGRTGPPLQVEEWITAEPDTDDKLVVVAFWATWCGPCIQSIPRLNEIADKHGDDVAVIGVSNEASDRIMAGMSRRNLTAESFKYSVGYDSRGAMAGTVSVQGIPHSIVMCSDWVVRWQGHPMSLNDAIVSQLIEANKADAVESTGRWLASR